MFRIKICGLTQLADADCVAAAGADAVGLNFYARSPRCVTLPTAQAIASALPARVLNVGLFVNETPERIRELAEAVPLDVVQLHGDETPEAIQALADLRVMKAFRLGPGEAARVLEFVAACEAQHTPLAAVLVDAFHPGSYGGTGRAADWQAALELRSNLRVPLILAGGLTAQNVAAAIVAVRPAGVDTASGVESVPGQKDPQRVCDFAAAAQQAFQEL